MKSSGLSRTLEASWSRASDSRHHPLDAALSMLERLFRAGVSLRSRAYAGGWLRSRRVSVPVVSVGGLEVGGVGKTPLVVELARLAAEAGGRPAIVSRGHGRRGGRRIALVPVPFPPTAWEFYGDEPVWMAERLQSIPGAVGVVVGADRVAGAELAAATGASVVLLDDGYQHRRISRECDVVCVRADAPFGNGHCLPRGPLREPPHALRRAGVLVVTGGVADARACESLFRRMSPDATLLSSDAERRLVPVQGLPVCAGESVLLVTGIAHPERVRRTLEAMGVSIAHHEVFPDHHPFSATELLALERAGRPLVTTAKDWVRMRCRIGPAARVAVLEQRFVWHESYAETFWRNLFTRLYNPDTRKPGENSPGPG